MSVEQRLCWRLGQRALEAAMIGVVLLCVIAPRTEARSGVCVESIGKTCIRRMPPKKRIASVDARQEYLLGITQDGKRLVQAALFNLGYRFGPVDGKFGPLTRGAIRSWQSDVGEKSTGYLTERQFGTLLRYQKQLEDAQWRAWWREAEREQELWMEGKRRRIEAEQERWEERVRRYMEAKDKQWDAETDQWEREMRQRQDQFLRRR